MATEVTLKEMPGLLGTVRERWFKAAVRGLQSAAARGVQTIVVQIIPSRSPMPVDRATFKAGWRAWPAPDGAVIENFEPHAILIEKGVRGENVKIGRKMIDALTEWAIRKRIVADEKEAKRFAWALAKKMKQRGIFRGGRGFGILQELVERYLPDYIAEEVAREIEEEGLA